MSSIRMSDYKRVLDFFGCAS